MLGRVGEGLGGPGGGGVVRPEAEAGKGWLLFPKGVMGMMQTEPRSKSLAATRTSAAKEPPPGSAPPLVPGTGGRRECKSYFTDRKKKKEKEKFKKERKEKEKKIRAVPRKRVGGGCEHRVMARHFPERQGPEPPTRASPATAPSQGVQALGSAGRRRGRRRWAPALTANEPPLH